MSGCFWRFVPWIAFGVEGGLLTARFVHYIILYIICLPNPVLLLTLCSCNLIHSSLQQLYLACE